MTVAVATDPEAKASPWAAPSSAASTDSYAARVGLPERE